jgi:hypothetical protein
MKFRLDLQLPPPEDGRSHGCATGLGEEEEEIVKAWWAKVLQ